MRRVVLGFVVALGFGCASHSGSAIVSSPSGPVVPYVVQNGQPPTYIVNFPNVQAFGAVVRGHDGATWFVRQSDRSLYRIDDAGNVSSVPSNATFEPADLAVGSDGRFYMTEMTGGGSATHNIAVTDVNGVGTEYVSPDEPSEVWLASDGAIWFTLANDGSHIGRLDTLGNITEYPVAQPAIALAPDSAGNIWFISDLMTIGKYNIATGAQNFFSTPCSSEYIVAGIDAIYLACPNTIVKVGFDGSLIGTVSNGKAAFQYQLGRKLAVGPRPYNDIYLAGYSTIDVIHPDLSVKHFKYFRDAQGIAVGSDGNVWGSTGEISVFVVHVLSVSPSSVLLNGIGQTQTIDVKEVKYHKTFTATTSNARVATVSGSAPTFVIQEQGPGTCTVTVADKLGNSFAVPVTAQ